MVQLKNVLFLLSPRTASRAATTNKATRNASRRRMNSPRAQEEKNNFTRFRQIYNNMNREGLLNYVTMFKNTPNNFINIYAQKPTASKNYKIFLKIARKHPTELMNFIIKKKNPTSSNGVRSATRHRRKH